MDHFLSVDELHKVEFYFWTSDQALPNLDRPKLQLQLLGLLVCKRTCRVLNEWKTGYDMRSQSWILHFLGYLCKVHRTLSRMQKASQSVGKTSKPDGWVIFTQKNGLKIKSTIPGQGLGTGVKRFLPPVKETSEHMVTHAQALFHASNLWCWTRNLVTRGPFCRPSLTKKDRGLWGRDQCWTRNSSEFQHCS